MDHCHQKEEKREAGRKKACSEGFVEAHESQFENVPFCTAVAATRLRSQLDPTNSQLYTKAQMDKKLQRFPWKNMWCHTLHLSPFQNASLPTWCECSYQIFLHNSWAARGQGGQAGQTCGCFTWRTVFKCVWWKTMKWVVLSSFCGEIVGGWMPKSDICCMLETFRLNNLTQHRIDSWI